MASDLTAHERAFLAALGGIHRAWVVAAREALSADEIPVWVENAESVATLRKTLSTPEARQAFAALASELLGGALHSTLVCLDGGSNQADTDELTVAGADGAPFRKYLHEFIFGFVNKDET